MMHSYDQYGYLSDTPIAGRVTNITPPDIADWPAGMRPNWTGFAWVYLPWPMPAPPEPPGSRVLTHLEFLDLFSDVELATILTAAEQYVAIQVWIKKLELSGEVDLDSPRTAAGLQALELNGLLLPGRAAEILQAI